MAEKLHGTVKGRYSSLFNDLINQKDIKEKDKADGSRTPETGRNDDYPQFVRRPRT